MTVYVMRSLPKTPEARAPRVGRPPQRWDNREPGLSEVPAEVRYAEDGPSCLWCGHGHPVDNRHDRSVE